MLQRRCPAHTRVTTIRLPRFPMRHGFMRTLLAVTLLGGLAAGRGAAATAEIKDNAHLFSDKALREANDILKDVEQHARHVVVVETYAGIPPEKQVEFDR